MTATPSKPSLQVWNSSDRDWAHRFYGSYDAYVVMKNYMQRESVKLKKAARLRAITVAKKRRAS